MKPTIFLSYSHKDETEKEELLTHLRVLESEGQIDLWVDDQIPGGGDWQNEIKQAINKAQIGILLVTANFLSSKFILNQEIPRLLELCKQKGLVVFPIIAKPCAWRKIEWLTRMNVRPKNGDAIWQQGRDPNPALATVVEEIADIIRIPLPPPPPPPTKTLKCNFTLNWQPPRGDKRTALVLTLDSQTELQELVSVVTDYWKLPLLQNTHTVAYGIKFNKESIGLDTPISELKLEANARLELVPLLDQLIVSIPSRLVIFDIVHPNTKSAISIVTLSEAITLYRVKDYLESLWQLPIVSGKEMVHYELHREGQPQPLNVDLSKLNIRNGSNLNLVQQPGLLVIDEEEDDDDDDENENMTEPDVAEELTIEPEDASDDPNSSPASNSETHQPPPISRTPPEGDKVSTRFTYLDFELQVSGSNPDYQISVISSPAGEAQILARYLFKNDLERDNRLKDLQIALLRSGGKRRETLSPEQQKTRELGICLFNWLFGDDVKNRYDVSVERSHSQAKGLRLRLRIHPPELAVLPWEFMYDPRRAEYVCLSRTTPIIRYPEVPQPIQPLAIAPPLRILGMCASPKDLPSLDIPLEKQRVEQALEELQKQGLVKLIWVEGQTWRDLQQMMWRGEWHIFHFIGHGGFDHITEEGYIALVDENTQRIRHLRASDLGRLLAGYQSMRMALLNVCEGARASEQDVFSSTAARLIQRGIPAVLAMQYAITDQAAIEFATTFYRALAVGMAVDTAVTEARMAISFAVPNTIEWGTPVLYMRSPDGQLFDLASQR